MGPQVREFAGSLGWDHRRAFKKAVLGLATEKGDLRALPDELSGYYRPKVARHRVIFRYQPGRFIEGIFAEERKLVYKIFESEMARLIGH